MARIRIQDENREITDTQEICAFLKPFGIWYEKWDVEGRIGPEATNEEILTAYAPEIERLKKAGNFVTADVINVSPATPNLDAMLAKFSKEHTHSEDEVRFTVKGSGVFHIHPEERPGVRHPGRVGRPDQRSLPARSTGSTCATTRRSAASACSRTCQRLDAALRRGQRPRAVFARSASGRPM